MIRGRGNRWRACWWIASAAIATLATQVVLASGESPPARVVDGAAHVAPDGQITAGARVVIRDGRIVGLGGDAPADAAVDRYEGAVLCPGLIDCRASIGAIGGLAERRTPVEPEVRAADAFNAYTYQIRAALSAGVTTFALCPDDQNLVGGQIAICCTSGSDGVPYVLKGAGPLQLSIAPDAMSLDREPTSRIGAVGLLRDTLREAKARADQDTPLSRFARGEWPGILTAPSAADVLTAVDLQRQFNLRLAVVHTNDAHQGAELAVPLAGVIVGPFNLFEGRRRAESAGRFEAAGAAVAIAGGLPAQPAESLRIGAAVAARSGLSTAAARRAITATPAALLGVGDELGAIKPGYRANLVVFSGDPLDLRSRVLAVYIDGRRVYHAADGAARGGE